MPLNLKYTGKIGSMLDQYQQADVVNSGSRLTLVICAARAGLVNPPKEGGQRWSGTKEFLARQDVKDHGVSEQDVSRAATIIRHYLMQGDTNVLTCDEQDVSGIVVAFVNSHGDKAIGTIYNELKATQKAVLGTADAGKRVWTLEGAVANLVKTARSQGIDPVTVQLAVESAIRTQYGS